MDNMAYLQQISQTGGVNNGKQGKAFGLIDKGLALKLGIGFGAAIILLVIIMAIVNAMSVVDTRAHDVLVHAWYQSEYLNETTSQYSREVKSSDLRGMATALVGVTNEIRNRTATILLEDYGEEVDDLDDSDIAMEELQKNTELNESLELARISGTLDYTFVREYKLQIALLLSCMSEYIERTETDTYKEMISATHDNLDTLYNQFKNYEDLGN
ncbi:MAG: hypothetical protein Q4E47_02480 [Candidatus Saccharibacteria bacterium]|nr:hypothetical protein [Candidatus Saccharibacteria bacterium]